MASSNSRRITTAAAAATDAAPDAPAAAEGFVLFFDGRATSGRAASVH
jgi:hypothetical protein